MLAEQEKRRAAIFLEARRLERALRNQGPIASAATPRATEQ